jgi:bacteriocin-type transport-associated protein
MRKVLYILGQLSDDDIEWLMHAGNRRRIPTGTVLIREGKPVDALYIVLEGLLAITVAALDGKEVDRCGCGEIVGEMSFVDALPPSATVTAVQDSVVLSVPRATLAKHLAQDTGFAARFYRALAVFLSDRLRHTTRRAAAWAGGELDEHSTADDELDPSVLDNVHLAGARFDLILKRLMGS